MVTAGKTEEDGEIHCINNTVTENFISKANSTLFDVSMGDTVQAVVCKNTAVTVFWIACSPVHPVVLPVQEWPESLRFLGEERNQQKLPAIVSQQIDLTSRITHKKNLPDTLSLCYPGGEDKPPPRTVQIRHPLMDLVRNGDNLILSEGFISEDCFRPLLGPWLLRVRCLQSMVHE